MNDAHSGAQWIDVAGAEEIPVGGVKTFPLGTTEVAVFNLDGEFYALEDICTHDGGYLASGEIKAGEVVCPRHGAHFDIRTGEALCAPAYEPVPSYAVKIENGRVLLSSAPR